MTALSAPVRGEAVRLRRGTLPPWAQPAVAVAVVAVTAGLFAVTDLQGRAGFLVVAVPLFVAGTTAASVVVEGGRRARDRLATTLVATSFLLALLPLVSVLLLTVQKGAGRFDLTYFTHSQNGIGARDAGGGAYHAILGTVEQVGLASLMAIPVGLLAAVYLVEYGRGRLARTISFFVDVMTGLPSIVAGLFVLAFWILALGRGFSGFAGSLALALLMLPVVIRGAEEMFRLVPDELREASFALGVPKWRTILKIILPTALPGVVTGVMLAVARVTGETAPLLLTTFGTNSINTSPFDGPQAGLPQFVYGQAGLPQDVAIDRAWTGALTLILIVMVLNLAARLIARRGTGRIDR